MKRLFLPISLSALLLTSAVSLLASSPSVHIARDGDKLHPGLSLSSNLILSVNDSARTLLLNPDAVSFSKSNDASAYVDGDTISYVQSATKHRFVFHSDTLSYLGFENRATDFRLDSAVLVAKFPLKEGNEVSDRFSGHMLQYGSMLLKRIKGESKSRIEKGWTLTDGTDTIGNAIRLIWTLDMAYADSDSIDPRLPDSITSPLISDLQVDVRSILSEHLLTERSLWFTESARYPILSDSRVSRVIQAPESETSDTIPVSMLAMYYPPSFQYSDTGEEFDEDARKVKSTEERYDYTDDSDNRLNIGEPTVNDNSISIMLSSAEGNTETILTLYTDSGIRLTDPVTVSVGTIPQACSIEIPSGWKGVLMLRVEAGESSFTRKVII